MPVNKCFWVSQIPTPIGITFVVVSIRMWNNGFDGLSDFTFVPLILTDRIGETSSKVAYTFGFNSKKQCSFFSLYSLFVIDFLQ